MGNWLINEGPKYIVLLLWLGINAVLFAITYLKYANAEEYFYLRKLVGSSLPWARSTAACLNFNCMLILLPVCRNLLSYVRGCSTCCRRTVRRQLDRNVSLHIFLGYSVCFFAAVHIAAHCFNVERFLAAHRSKSGLVTTLSYPQLGTNSSYLSVNPFSDASAYAAIVVFKTWAGVTGIIMTVALVLMASSATFVIRRSVFEVFYYTHHLFVVFYVCLLIHGLGGIIRSQTNCDKHKPEVCAEQYQTWATRKSPHCPIPWFTGGHPQTWMWVVVPMAVYVIERILRRFRAFQAVKISKVVSHPSRVFELQLHKSSFVSTPGQYVLINCPSISCLEWHPFTLTSAPGDDHFSVHVRRVGDWTNALAEACHVDDTNPDTSLKLPRLCVDGPFGASSEDYLHYDVDLLIGTGIGITPFASILKHIWYNVKDTPSDGGLTKVYVVWVCSETAMFEWFYELLDYLESQLRTTRHCVSFIEYDIYLTRGWDTDQARNIVLHGDEYRDVITGLRQKTQFGRPQWDKLFTDIVATHPESSVGVFFCGAPEASKQLHRLCNQYSATGQGGTRFFYNKEHF